MNRHRLTLLLLLSACSEDQTEGDTAKADGNDAAMARREECSTGPLFDLDRESLRGRWEEAGVPCTPHCGQDSQRRWQGTGLHVYGASAVPTGACRPEAERCGIDIGLTCCGQPGIGDLWFNYVCSCEDERWACAGSYMGGGTCSPCDAGVSE